MTFVLISCNYKRPRLTEYKTLDALIKDLISKRDDIVEKFDDLVYPSPSNISQIFVDEGYHVFETDEVDLEELKRMLQKENRMSDNDLTEMEQKILDQLWDGELGDPPAESIDIVKIFVNLGLNISDGVKLINDLINKGFIYQPAPGKYYAH